MKISTYIAVAALAFSTASLAANPEVELKTNMGVITLELYPDKAPKTVENFLQYVKDGHFKGTIFHRVINGFMVQGGGFTADFAQKKTRPPVQNEANNGLKPPEILPMRIFQQQLGPQSTDHATGSVRIVIVGAWINHVLGLQLEEYAIERFSDVFSIAVNNQQFKKVILVRQCIPKTG